jgi:uncharacterized protein
MKINIHEITDLETELDFTQEEKWVIDAVECVDESVNEVPGLVARPKVPRDVTAHFSLRKVDEVIVVSGDIHTHIQLVCSRCANPYKLDCTPHFSGLFCTDPVMAGVGHLEGEKPAGQNKGHARHAHDESHQMLMAEGKDLDITYLSQDFIDLKALLTEHLQLQIPFQPLCREECKGMCANCGSDLNIGRCACKKVAKTNPFSVLKDFKI